MSKTIGILVVTILLGGLLTVFIKTGISKIFGEVDASTTRAKDVESLLCVPKPPPPIKTNAAAACFAAYVEGVADSLRKAQKQVNYEGWMIFVERNKADDAWDVHIKSTGKILPSYLCRLSFTESGQLIKRSGSLVDCRYSK